MKNEHLKVKPSVLLIGAGALGRRHLQSMLSVENVDIYVIEPDLDSQQEAQILAASIAHQHSIVWFRELPIAEISLLPSMIDVAIIATSSGPRFSLASQLLLHWTVRFLILEKVLFQKLHHFSEFQLILNQTDTRAYVNCPRRQYQFYQQVRSLVRAAPLRLKVSGVNWGLACNSIHFIDLLAWLRNCQPKSLDTHLLLPQVFPSKRSGYLEIAGQLILTYQDLSQLQLQCMLLPDSPPTLQIEIFQEDTHLILDEQQGIITFAGQAGTKEIKAECAPYQSQLTGFTINQLLITGMCGLSEYTESSALHLSLLPGLLQFFSAQAGRTLDLCPIT